MGYSDDCRPIELPISQSHNELISRMLGSNRCYKCDILGAGMMTLADVKLTEEPVPVTAYNCYGHFEQCVGEGIGCPDKEKCKRATEARINGVQ
jgi:hypothetical protein